MIRIALAVLMTAACIVPAEAQWRGRGWGHGSYYDRGGGIIGGVIGGIIGNVIAEQFRPQPYYPPPVFYQPPQPNYVPEYNASMQYCMQRFRSYNPQTGYYFGYDNQYHPCP